jgi:dihydroorotate dehydrogenase electron transfer subunit
LALLAEQARTSGRNVTAAIAAPKENRLLFVKRLETIGVNVHTIVDESESSIVKGISPLLGNSSLFDSAYIYATERISKAVMDIASDLGIPSQVMIERDIHCGTGICGECSIDPTGWRVCVEGPVFSDVDLRNSEFGNYRRHSLKKHKLQKGE